MGDKLTGSYDGSDAAVAAGTVGIDADGAFACSGVVPGLNQ
jgi:hypothetical protein